MNPYSRKFQWAQLIVLTVVHGVLDLSPGIMHSALPGIQTEYPLHLNLPGGIVLGEIALGGILLGVFNFTSNGVQVLTGHWRDNKDRPAFHTIGLMMCMLICLFALLPRKMGSYPAMLIVAVIAGWGVGFPHPEAMRALHAMDKISSAITTGVYMAGGIAGFAFGGWIGPVLIRAFGMNGLYLLMPLPIIGILLMCPMRIRLAVETIPAESDPRIKVQKIEVSFWLVMALTTLSAMSSATLVWILPQRLFEIGTGGLSVMLFMLGGGTGSFALGWIAHKVGELRCTLFSIAMGLPLLIIHIANVERPWAPWLLFAAGFLLFGCYPLMVSLARGSAGPGFGRRMGLIIGGVWGIACLAPIILGPVAEKLGVNLVLLFVPVGYMLAILLGTFMMLQLNRRIRKAKTTG